MVGGSHTHYCITPVPRLGAGALMLNAWDWTVTIINFPDKFRFTNMVLSVLLKIYTHQLSTRLNALM